jgi:hypothetical protein
MDGRRPVPGLGAADFELWDNGVPQEVDEAVAESGSLDVSILLDTSGSVSGLFENRLVQAVKETVGLLRPEDHAELVTFDRVIRRTVAVHGNGGNQMPQRIGDGGTALFDAIAAGLMENIEPGRRHLIVALTDGLDTQSVISRSSRQALVARSNAVVDIIALSLSGRTSNFYFGNFQGAGKNTREAAGDYDYLLREITTGSNGTFYDLRPGASFIDSLREAVGTFRQRYTLRFQPTGVERKGWHELRVKLKSGKFEVHARKGYFGDNAVKEPASSR